jgi:hypothetical protein
MKTENVHKACCCPDKEDSGTSADQKSREFHNKLHLQFAGTTIS